MRARRQGRQPPAAGGAPQAPARPRARALDLAGAGVVRRRPDALRRHPAAGARGHRQQAAHLALRLRRAQPGLAQVRRTATAARTSWAAGARRRAPPTGWPRCWSASSTARRAGLPRPGRQRHRRRRQSRADASCVAPLARADSPFDDEVPRVDARGTVWVEPVLVVDVETHGVGYTSGCASRRTAASAPTSRPTRPAGGPRDRRARCCRRRPVHRTGGAAAGRASTA